MRRGARLTDCRRSSEAGGPVLARSLPGKHRVRLFLYGASPRPASGAGVRPNISGGETPDLEVSEHPFEQGPGAVGHIPAHATSGPSPRASALARVLRATRPPRKCSTSLRAITGGRPENSFKKSSCSGVSGILFFMGAPVCRTGIYLERDSAGTLRKVLRTRCPSSSSRPAGRQVPERRPRR